MKNREPSANPNQVILSQKRVLRPVSMATMPIIDLLEIDTFCPQLKNY